MKTDGFVIIAFNGVSYKIKKDKLQMVFSILENRKTVIKNDKQVSELLEKYQLYDKDFLERVNNI